MEGVFEYNGKPVAKPRMVRSDKYKKRPVVMNYWTFKDRISRQAKVAGFKLGNAYRVTFVMPMPESLSEKKKAESQKSKGLFSYTPIGMVAGAMTKSEKSGGEKDMHVDEYNDRIDRHIAKIRAACPDVD